VTLIAAGATYHIVLSIFPGMSVLVSTCGLLTDPSDLAKQIGFTRDVLPPSILLPQLEALAHKGPTELSLAFAASVLVAFGSATSGVKALFDAMNVRRGRDAGRCPSQSACFRLHTRGHRRNGFAHRAH
jgi:membrane protein